MRVKFITMAGILVIGMSAVYGPPSPISEVKLKICHALKQGELIDAECPCGQIQLHVFSTAKQDLFIATVNCLTGTGGPHNFVTPVANEDTIEIVHFFQGYIDSVTATNLISTLFYTEQGVANIRIHREIRYNPANNTLLDSVKSITGTSYFPNSTTKSQYLEKIYADKNEIKLDD